MKAFNCVCDLLDEIRVLINNFHLTLFIALAQRDNRLHLCRRSALVNHTRSKCTNPCMQSVLQLRYSTYIDTKSLFLALLSVVHLKTTPHQLLRTRFNECIVILECIVSHYSVEISTRQQKGNFSTLSSLLYTMI